MTRVVLAGYLVRYPLGGYAWQALHFLAGFRALGCEVLFYEDTAYYAGAYAPGPHGVMVPTEDYGVGIAVTRAFLDRHGFGDAWAFVDVGHGRAAGVGATRARDALADADLFVNLGGVNRVPRALRSRAVSAYVDLDPSYTQLRLAGGDARLAALVADHDVAFTFGENIGTAACPIPGGGFAWRPLRQPVMPELWTPLPLDAAAPFTTIGKWDSVGRDVVFEGRLFTWRKRTEWWRFLDLPRRTGARFRIAMDLGEHPDDLCRLVDAGWEVVDPFAISADPERYRNFIRTSRGEFTVAKDVNVRLRSGWFSDRAACYLAAGRPVVNQETGFDRRLPVGEGIFAYRTIEEAAAACRAVMADGERQGGAARALAERHFAPARALAPILETIS